MGVNQAEYPPACIMVPQTHPGWNEVIGILAKYGTSIKLNSTQPPYTAADNIANKQASEMHQRGLTLGKKKAVIKRKKK